MITGTIAIAVVSMGAVRLIGWIPLLVAVMVPFGLGLGLAQPITMAWVAAIAPASRRGSAMSLRLTGNRLGHTVSPVIAGSVAGALAAGGVLGVVTVSLLAGGVIAKRVDVADVSGGATGNSPAE